jgi:hypothetical protein
LQLRCDILWVGKEHSYATQIEDAPFFWSIEDAPFFWSIEDAPFFWSIEDAPFFGASKMCRF